MIEFADTATGRVTLALAADGVTLAERGGRLHFRGDWGIRAEDDARFFGRCTLGVASHAASLQLEAGRDASADVQVTLRAVDGRVVLGPLLLQRVIAGEPVLQPQPPHLAGDRAQELP